MDEFQVTAKGGKQQAKKPFETPLPSVLDEQREQNKKKKKEANKFMYGASATTEEDSKTEEPKPTAAKKEEEVPAATASGSDSEEETKASGSKKHQLKMAQRNQNKKKGGKGGNRKKGGQQDSEDEDAKKEEEEDKQEEKKATPKVAGQREPLQTVYCRICGIPPEYCMFSKKDFSECKEWIKTAHPDLFQQIYDEPTETQPKAEGEEAKEQPEQQQKKKKKKSLAPSGDTDIKIYKAKRGGKKMICSVVGLENYGVPLKDVAKLMGKKFACGCAVAIDDKYGECIQIQGDVQERFEDFVQEELAKYKVPFERVKFEEVKKKKKAEDAGEEGDDQE